MKLFEKRTLSTLSLRNVCVKMNWCTLMSNERYGEFLDFVREKDNLKTFDLLHIAETIFDYSEMDCNDGYTDALSGIMFELAENCVSTFSFEE